MFIFKFLIKAIISLVLIFIISIAVLFALDMKVNLNFLNKPIEIAVEQVINRDFNMDGDVVLIPTLWPTLEIDNVSISNPTGEQWSSGKTMLNFGHLHLQLGIVPLLTGKIYVASMIAEDITLNLESDKQGNQNWDLSLSNNDKNKSLVETDSNSSSDPIFHLKALDIITLNNIKLNYTDQLLKKTIHFNLEKLEAKVPLNKDISLFLNGKLQGKEFSMQLKGGTFALLQDKTQAWPIHINSNLAGTEIELSGTLQHGKDPHLNAKLEIGETDIGATLSWLNIVHGIKAGTHKLIINAKIRGDSLTKILTNAEVSMILNDAWWTFEDKNTGGQLAVEITNGKITIEPKKPVEINLDGLLDKEKINIKLTGTPIADYIKANFSAPLTIAVDGFNSHLELKTKIAQSMNVKRIGFNMKFKGNNLSDLNSLLKMDLPPIGPYSLEGLFASTERGYYIKKLFLNIKESQLLGNLYFNTSVKPPMLNVNLESKQIQVNNFVVGDWTPSKKSTPTTTKAKASEQGIEADNKITSNKKMDPKKVLKILSYDNLSRLNANIKVAVGDVFSGKDKLGYGSASLQLQKAKLTLKLDKLVFPGGRTDANFIYHPSANKQLDISLQAKIKQFDYGILARRIDKTSKVEGLLSLDLDLASKNAKDLDSLLKNSQGHIDFAWKPKTLNADLFEMWAVNIMTSVLKKTDEDKKSHVNCVIARLTLNDGIMKEKVIYANTTKMTIIASVEANFHDRTIKVAAAPNAKEAEFFSLATPIALEGHFDNFSLALNPLALTKTTLSFVTSPFTVPIQRILEETPSAEGVKACKEMWAVSDSPKK
jgi:uncharacterized protein involved in outer membrane biogenesis